MEHVFLGLVSLLASGLTFFTGFGLGTLLLPAFALFFAVSTAVALTAVVHLINNLFKLLLVGRQADWRVVSRFGVPAILAALLGAFLLGWLDQLPPVGHYVLAERMFAVMPIKLVVATLMLAFALLELWPRFKRLALPPRFVPLGGMVSGFFGGLSGHQGAFRSAFLIRLGLDKEAFVATGVVIAVLVDVSRLSLYWQQDLFKTAAEHETLLLTAIFAAFAGAMAGQRLLKKVPLATIERTVAVLLALMSVALGLGWI